MTASLVLGSLLRMRKIETEVEARRCFVSAKTSGLSLAAWARAQGIEARSLYSWRATIRRREVAAERAGEQERHNELPAPRFVELIAKPEPSTRYAVWVGDVRIEVDDSFRPETLARLVATVRAC